jgi:hypothetical protein
LLIKSYLHKAAFAPFLVSSSSMFNTLSSRLMQIFSPARILELAKESSWYKRRGKICPFEFLFSSVGQASALELTLNAQVATFTEPVSRQAVDQRYNPQAVEFFGAAFKDILTKTLAWKTDSPMSQSLQRAFRAVRLFDSTHCACADALASLFPGYKGAGGSAGIKILLSYEYGSGQLHPLEVLAANNSDQSLADTAQQKIGSNVIPLQACRRGDWRVRNQQVRCRYLRNGRWEQGDRAALVRFSSCWSAMASQLVGMLDSSRVTTVLDQL